MARAYRFFAEKNQPDDHSVYQGIRVVLPLRITGPKKVPLLTHEHHD